jgi:hypothetical protein
MDCHKDEDALPDRPRSPKVRKQKEQVILDPTFYDTPEHSSETSTSYSEPGTRDRPVHQVYRGVLPLRVNSQDLGQHYPPPVTLAKCPVCHNLPSFVEPAMASMTKLNESKERGCPTCSLIIRGISEFSNSLSPEIQSRFNSCAVDKVWISCSKWESLTIRLELHDTKLGFDLDFFTATSMS